MPVLPVLPVLGQICCDSSWQLTCTPTQDHSGPLRTRGVLVYVVQGSSSCPSCFRTSLVALLGLLAARPLARTCVSGPASRNHVGRLRLDLLGAA